MLLFLFLVAAVPAAASSVTVVPCSVTSTLPSDFAVLAEAGFAQYTSVFGGVVHLVVGWLVGLPDMLPEALTHAALAAATFLDSNNDGVVDDANVAQSLKDSKATMIMGANTTTIQFAFDAAFENNDAQMQRLEESGIKLQNLGSHEMVFRKADGSVFISPGNDFQVVIFQDVISASWLMDPCLHSGMLR